MKNKISDILYNIFIKSWQKRLAVKISLLMWFLILMTVGAYVLFSIPFQKSLLIERMNIEAQDVASSFIHANASAIITDDYQLVVDYSVSMLKTSNSIDYIVVVKKDGSLSLVFEKEGWNTKVLKDYWVNPGDLTLGKKIKTEFSNEETYHIAKQFLYSGVDWGWVHIGLSLKNYNKAVSDFNERTLVLSMIVILLSLFASILFSKKITRPIIILAETAKKIEDGDLSARVSQSGYDEIGDLAISFNKMTEAVSKSNDELEAKVLERTNELAKSNIQLTSEIEEKKKTEIILNQYTTKLQTLEEIYKGIISSKSAVEIFKNSSQKIHNNLINFSRSSAAIFDFTNNNAVLHAFSFDGKELNEVENTFPLSHFSSINKLKDHPYFLEENLSTKEDKSQMEQLVYSNGVKSYICIGLKFQGHLIGELNFAFSDAIKFDQLTLDTILEISNQIAVAIVQLSLEEKLKHHSEELQDSLKEKEVLLKEIHHRVKNNLQIITSLLYLQSLKIEDEETKEIFKDSQNRVKSLALVHEKLYQSKDLARIDFSDYLKNLSNFIFTTYKTNVPNLHIDYDLDEVFLSVEVSVPLGLIINELLSNALKYAFRGHQIDISSYPRILLRLKKLNGSEYIISISDNGAGLKDNFDIDESESLGLKLVTSLVQQIEGKLEIHPKNDTEFKITFNGNIL